MSEVKVSVLSDSISPSLSAMDVQGGGGGGGGGVAKPNDPTTASSVDDLQDSLDKFIQLIYQRCIIIQ